MLPAVAAEPDLAKRFLIEAKAMASVNHPAVAAIHDYGHSDGVTFLVMEFIDWPSAAAMARAAAPGISAEPAPGSAVAAEVARRRSAAPARGRRPGRGGGHSRG